MTACARRRDELIERALGAPESSMLAAHLSACAVCAEVLDAERARLNALDAGLRELVAHEPSPNLRPRVLAHIDFGRAASAWPWRLGAALIATLLIVGSAAITRDVLTVKKSQEQSRAIASTGAVISQWRAPSDVLLDIK